MSTQSLTTQQPTRFSMKTFIRRHPLLTYFVMVYVFTWLGIMPVFLSKNGTGVLPYRLSDVAAFALFMLPTFLGPTLWAFIVTAVLEGKAGVQHFLRRYIQWRVGLRWYVLIIFAYPALYLLAASISLGMGAFSTFIQHWPVFFVVYLPHLFLLNMIDALGEEPGFRGFALTRMQDKFGPFVGTLLVGILHALWHLPAYLIPQAIGVSFSLSNILLNSVGIIVITFIWAWVFNNAKGSILIAMLLHSASNATYAFTLALFPNVASLYLSSLAVYGAYIVFALVIIVATRGRLSYTPRLGLLPLTSKQEEKIAS